jgi:hypothetical protein
MDDVGKSLEKQCMTYAKIRPFFWVTENKLIVRSPFIHRRKNIVLGRVPPGSLAFGDRRGRLTDHCSRIHGLLPSTGAGGCRSGGATGVSLFFPGRQKRGTPSASSGQARGALNWVAPRHRGDAATEPQILQRNESRDIHMPRCALDSEGPKNQNPRPFAQTARDKDGVPGL